MIKRCLVVSLIVLLLAIGVGPVTVDALDANDFAISSFDADYYLSKDSKGRSRLKTIEKITAIFPEINQNHGIERAIPDNYDGHSLRLHVSGVTNGNGVNVAYTSYESGDNTVLRIGNADVYVHGAQTYRISYVSHDVTKIFADHDEFFWDVNGTEWNQVFGSVTARIHVPAALKGEFDNRQACYTGVAGSSAKECIMSQSAEGKGVLLSVTANRPLQSHENLSFVTGFAPKTFAAYQKTALQRVLPWLIVGWQAISGVILMVMIVVLRRLWRRYGKAPAGKGSIVPEYLPPKDLSVLQSATIVHKTEVAITAQIIDLAVRHYLKIYDIETKKVFAKKHTYELELVRHTNGLRPDERQIIDTIFGAEAAVGMRISMSFLSSKLYKTTEVILNNVDKGLVKEDYYFDRAQQRKKYLWMGGLMAFFGLILFSVGTCIAGIAMLIVASKLKPLTEKGVATRDYLRGLQEYMKMAEADRIKTLQSPEGAEKVGIDPTDNAQLVKLYEKLLPYAVLFGIEQQWAKQFAGLYREAPDWYGGNWATFNAAIFASSFHNFTVASASTFAPPNSSASSGFSGGGSSGGGGGGGGGGGW